MKKLILIYLTLFVCILKPSEYQLPADRRPPSGYWQSAGASGEPADGTVYNVVSDFGADPTNTTECLGVINSALNTIAIPGLNNVLYFPAGTYKVNGAIIGPNNGGNQYYGNWKIRGAIDANGNSLVTFNNIHTATDTSGMIIGPDGFFSSGGASSTITSGLTKGSNQITVTDGTNFNGYCMCRINLQNDPTLTWDTKSYPGSPVFNFLTVRAINKSGNIITIDQEIPETFSTDQTTGSYLEQWTYTIVGSVVIENVIFDGTNSSDHMITGFRLNGMICESYIRNVKVIGQKNYGFGIDNCSKITVDGCWVAGSESLSSNHSGFRISTVSQSLFIHNISEQNFPNWEINFGCTGNVFAYNYSAFSQENGATTNHAPQNNFNLYEANIISYLISDGYFGGERASIAYRNWLYGRKLNALDVEIDFPAYIAKRFSRNFASVGNILYTIGFGSFGGYWTDPYSLGQPNAGNSNSLGTPVSPSTGNWWYDTNTGIMKTWSGTLTTRTDAQNGVVTFSGGVTTDMVGHLALTESGDTVSFGNVDASLVRIASGNTFTVVANAITTLPTLNDPITFTVGHAGCQELDLDVLNSFEYKANYNYIANQIPAGESIGSDTLPDSLFASGPDARFTTSGFTWPPFDPYAPTPSHTTSIPAGYRRANNAWPVAGATTVANVTNLHVGTIRLSP